MTDFKKDMARIQALVGDAFSATGGLVALSDGGVMSEQKLQKTLEQTAAEFEKATLELRTLCEKHSPGKGGYGKRPPAPFCAIDGRVEKLGYNWLHIQLNTLLPHCRYQTPLWLTDTIRRLLIAVIDWRLNNDPFARLRCHSNRCCHGTDGAPGRDNPLRFHLPSPLFFHPVADG